MVAFTEAYAILYSFLMPFVVNPFFYVISANLLIRLFTFAASQPYRRYSRSYGWKIIYFLTQILFLLIKPKSIYFPDYNVMQIKFLTEVEFDNCNKSTAIINRLYFCNRLSLELYMYVWLIGIVCHVIYTM